MKHRTFVTALAASAVAFAGLVMHEGYRGEAYIPIKGDVPTIGFGATTRDDGTPVQMGDKTNPVQALVKAERDLRRFEGGLKRCLDGVRLHQHEYDAFLSLAYNVGAGAVCRSSIVAKLKRGDYDAACRTILDFRRAGGKDCAVRSNRCYGLWLRRQNEYRQCTGAEP